MSKITFGPARREDIWTIEENLRPADIEEFIYSTGRSHRKHFSAATPLQGTIIGYVDEEPAAVFGCVQMEGYGAPWLMGTNALAGPAVARALLKYGRRQFREWAGQYGLLKNHAYAHNKLHLKYIKALGCEVSAPQPYGPLNGAFVEFTYRRNPCAMSPARLR